MFALQMLKIGTRIFQERYKLIQGSNEHVLVESGVHPAKNGKLHVSLHSVSPVLRPVTMFSTTSENLGPEKSVNGVQGAPSSSLYM